MKRLETGLFISLAAIIGLAVYGSAGGAPGENAGDVLRVHDAVKGVDMESARVLRSEEAWRGMLSPAAYHVLREKGTERAFTGAYHDSKESGIYTCGGCGLDLFSSADKYDSGTGWPSFTRTVSPLNVAARADRSFFMKRTEVVCARCDGHLGHVFGDGPASTGKRYCINSAALAFKPSNVKEKEIS